MHMIFTLLKTFHYLWTQKTRINEFVDHAARNSRMGQDNLTKTDLCHKSNPEQPHITNVKILWVLFRETVGKWMNQLELHSSLWSIYGPIARRTVATVICCWASRSRVKSSKSCSRSLGETILGLFTRRLISYAKVCNTATQEPLLK